MRDVLHHLGGVVLAALVVSSAASAAETPPISGDVPVPGGRAALARALGLDTAPDRARFVVEIARLVHADSRTTRGYDESAFRRITAFFAASRRESTTDETDRVPLALPTLWSDVVFRRPVADTAIFAAVMSDRSAALVAFGLAALDDETLRYMAAHAPLVARLYGHHAAAFAAFAGQVRVHGGRVVVPGGEVAERVWEALLGERVDAPERFLLTLLARNAGRTAYLFDTIAHLDRSRAAFALGAWMPDPRARIERFSKLADVVSSSFPEWRVDASPFRRAADDLVSLLARVEPTGDGAPAPPASRSLWAAVLADNSGRAADGPGDAPDAPIDAAWLAAATLRGNATDRRARLDRFAFGVRVFATAPASSLATVRDVLRSFSGFPMLMLTLERAGVRDPSVYAAFAGRARMLLELDAHRRGDALAQLQSAIAIVDRLVRVHTIDRDRAVALLRRLADLHLDEGRFRGAVGRWFRADVRPLLPSGPSDEDALTQGLAGAPAALPPRTILFEGETYRLDLAGAEARRIMRIRRLQQTGPLDAPLQLESLAEALAGEPMTKPYAAPFLDAVDSLLADVLIAFAYAADLPDGDGTARFAGNLARRHDFGVMAPDRGGRDRTPWTAPKEAFGPTEPWHVQGAALGLDVTFAAMALKRLTSTPLARAPAISAPERDAFALSLSQLDRFVLDDRARNALVGAIDAGRQRVESMIRDRQIAEAVLTGIGMDGWRIRAIRWTLERDPASTLSFFSLAELAALGGANTGADLDRWGMAANALLGCLCQRWIAPAMVAALAGRPAAGLLAGTVADLNLRVAELLHELELPAALEPAVLGVALQDYLDRVVPVDGDDWITLVRTAQRTSRELVADAVAAAAAGGTLVRIRAATSRDEP
jgi:hypothetical protein